jgi:hypothetical protein
MPAGNVWGSAGVYGSAAVLGLTDVEALTLSMAVGESLTEPQRAMVLENWGAFVLERTAGSTPTHCERPPRPETPRATFCADRRRSAST